MIFVLFVSVCSYSLAASGTELLLLKWGCLCSCSSPSDEGLTLYSDSVVQSMKTTVNYTVQTNLKAACVRNLLIHLCNETSRRYCFILLPHLYQMTNSKKQNKKKTYGQSHSTLPHRAISSCTFSSCIMRFMY